MISPSPSHMDSNAPAKSGQEVTVATFVDQAKRAFALKKYEEAVEHYGHALELITAECGEDAPETADLYLLYGKALLENAISLSSVLGKEQKPEDGVEDDDRASGSKLSTNGPIISFSGDGEVVEGKEKEETDVDLFAQEQQADEEDNEDDSEHEGEDEENAEPEDDFNAAWEVLDLARAIYNRQCAADDDDEVKLKLADTYIALGDVSLETEKFDQAITDYQAALELKLDLLPISSRHIAEAHYKLSMVLDLTPGRLADSIVHAEKALASVESRLGQLRDGLSGQLPPEDTHDAKGKGKSTTTRLVRDDRVQIMTKEQMESEITELAGLRDDLALKVEELKTSPNDSLELNAPELAAQALDKELNGCPIGSSAKSPAPTVVNDLTHTVVKRKKKTPVHASPVKRKADSDADAAANSPSTEKKPRFDTRES